MMRRKMSMKMHLGERLSDTVVCNYRGTSLIRNVLLPEPHSGPVPRALWWSYGGEQFLMREVPLCGGNPVDHFSGGCAGRKGRRRRRGRRRRK